MSNGTKWVVTLIIIVVVIFALWWGGLLGNSPSTGKGAQSAAAVNSAPAPIDTSDAKIAEESAAIDAQMRVVLNQSSAFSKAPTGAKANLLATQLGNVGTLMTKLAERFQNRISTLTSIGFNTNALQGAVSDLNLQVSYSDSEAAAVKQLAATVTIKPGKGDVMQDNKNNVTLQQAGIELQKSQDYLTAAAKDIKSVIGGLKALDTSKVPAR